MAENTDTLEVLKQLAQQVRNATAEGENTAERVGRTLVGIIDHLGDGDSITEGMLDEKLEDYPTKQEVTIAMSRYVTTDFFARLFAPEGEDGAEVDVNDMEAVINAVRVKFGLHTDSYISAKGNNPESGSTVAGASALVDLSDVDISNPTDGQIFTWDAAKQKWTNADAPSAGLDEAALAEYLTDNHYAKKSDIPSLEGYATQTWASGQFALKTVAINAGTGLTGGGNLSASRTLSLATVGTAGTYTKVTVDAYGRVTGHGSLSAGDIPALAISKITGLQEALDEKMDAADFEELFEKVYVSGHGYAIRAKLALYTDSWMSAKGSNPDAGSTASGGIDEEELAEYLTTNGYATQTWVNQQGFLKSVAWGDVTGKPSPLANDQYYYGHGQLTTDFNDAVKGGAYFTTSEAWPSNGPGTSYRYGALAVFHTGTDNMRVAQLWISHHSASDGGVYVRMKYEQADSNWQPWARLLDNNCIGSYALTPSNYTDYTVTKTGGGASGTWSIGISGNAATATSAVAANRLATARTLWGQSFNGSANVSGALTGVTTITASGNIHITSGSYFATNSGWFQCNSSGKGLYNAEANARWYADANGWTADKNIYSTGGIRSDVYLQVGSARLMWDSSTGALYVQKSDGTACGFYATGFVSAKGANDDGGDTEATVLTIADERNTAIYPDTYAGRGIRGLFRANATDGLNDGGTYHTVLHIRQWANSSGGLSHQLAFTDNGGVWHRTATSETAWGEWSELSALSGLGDVSLSSPSNGQSLVYRNGVWRNETVSGGGGSASVAWSDITGKPSWIGSSKPSYAFSEITGTPSLTISSSNATNLSINVEGATKTIGSLYADYLGGTSKSGLFTGLTYSSNRLSVTIGGTTRSVTIQAGSSGSYLPLSGGTLSGNLGVNGTFRLMYPNTDEGAQVHKLLFYTTNPYGVITRIYTTGEASIQVQREGKNSETFTLSLNPLGGNVGIGTIATSYKLHVSGTAYATGGFQNGSDIRYKHVLSALPLTVAQVAAAPSFLFRWTDGTADGVQAGTSAQYWQQVMPQVVTESAGRLSMQYDKAALAAAIATARAVETLDQRVTRLEKENARLRRRLRQHKINV